MLTCLLDQVKSAPTILELNVVCLRFSQKAKIFGIYKFSLLIMMMEMLLLTDTPSLEQIINF